MLFTRTLRRKLLLGVGLVLGMLAILSISGMLGLRSYRETIRDLEYDLHHAPQQAALEHSVSSLFEPLLLLLERRSSALICSQFLKTSVESFACVFPKTWGCRRIILS